jgi:hypothetical protein
VRRTPHGVGGQSFHFHPKYLRSSFARHITTDLPRTAKPMVGFKLQGTSTSKAEDEHKRWSVLSALIPPCFKQYPTKLRAFSNFRLHVGIHSLLFTFGGSFPLQHRPEHNASDSYVAHEGGASFSKIYQRYGQICCLLLRTCHAEGT